MNLSSSSIEEIDSGLECSYLELRGSSIKILPEDLIVKKELYLDKELESKIKIPKGVGQVVYA